MEDKLTSELIHEVKGNARKWFIIAMALLVVLFASNMAWLYYWNLPDEQVEQIEQDNKDGNNNYIGEDGSINNGASSNNEDNTAK